MEKISEILKKTREEKKLSYHDIYKAINIHPKVLQAIEEGNFSLQPPIYMKSFIKEYLEFLGLNYEEYRQKLNEIFDHIEKKTSAVKNKSTFLHQQKVKKIRNSYYQLNKVIYFVYFTLFLGMLVIIYFTFFHSTQESTIFHERNLKPDTLIIGKEKTQMVQPSIKTDSISLEIKAIDTVWLNIIIDNKFSDKVILFPGNEKQWRGMNFFRLTIGNAGGVVIKRDGREIPPLGKRGVVVKSVTITRDQVFIGLPSKFYPQVKRNADSLSKILQPTVPKRVTPTLRDTKPLLPKR